MKTALAQAVLASVVIVGVVADASAQRRTLPSRSQPPTQAPVARVDVDRFLECYRDDRFPKIAVVVWLGAPRSAVSDEDIFFRDSFEADLQGVFQGFDVRMELAAKAAVLDDAENQRLVSGRRWILAADRVAQRLDVERVFFVTLVPLGRNVDGAGEFSGRYDIINTQTKQAIASRPFPKPITGMAPSDRGRLPKSIGAAVNGVAREMINDYTSNHCGFQDPVPSEAVPTRVPTREVTRNPPPVAPIRPVPRIDGPAEEDTLGVPMEMTVRVIGELTRRDPAAIREQVRDFEYLRHTIGVPQVRQEGTSRYLEMKVSAFGDPFLVGEDVSYGIFLATGKDSFVRRATDDLVVLEILDPAVSRWIGPEDERNRGIRDALRRVYAQQGRPPIAVVTRSVSTTNRWFERQRWQAKTDTWHWYHAFRDDLPSRELGSGLHAGDAMTRALTRRFANVDLDSANASEVFALNAAPGISERDLQSPGALERVLRDQGFELIADGRGEVVLSPDGLQTSYGFGVRSIATNVSLASTDTSSRSVSEDDVPAGVPTSEMADELAAQLIDQLFERWADGLETTHLVLVDEPSIAYAEDIQRAVGSVDGVEYTIMRSLGQSGQIIEIAHRGAADDIRRALTEGNDSVRFRMTPGSTANRMRIELMS
ncbi:MAG: hypothetical protein AAGI53_10255 [Planctomycetota bacterium]